MIIECIFVNKPFLLLFPKWSIREMEGEKKPKDKFPNIIAYQALANVLSSLIRHFESTFNFTFRKIF